jgi:hypothetical protein
MMSNTKTRSKRAKTHGDAPAGAEREEEIAGAQVGAEEVRGSENASKAQEAEANEAPLGTAEAKPRRRTKASILQQMVAGPEGATLAALTQATGWQAHTVRSALTRLRQAGHRVERSRSDEGGTVYRTILPSLAAEPEPEAPAT